MKILYIITGLHYGGAEKLLYLTCKWIITKFDAKIDIMYFDPEAPMLPRFALLAVRCTQINRSLKGFLTLTLYLKKNRYDVIHTHLIHADILGRIAALLSGTKRNVFTTVHGTEWFRRENSLYPRIIRFADRLLSLPPNHFIIAISKSVQNILIVNEKINPQKITLLYNAVEVSHPLTKSPTGTFKILYVGRLSPEKNIPCLISALNNFPDDNISLTLLGDGGEREKLVELVERLDLQKIVTFAHGRIDIDSFYQTSDVLVLPSQYEGLGIVILEAFSHAMPVIGSNVEGIAELLCDGRGLLFESNNSLHLKSKLIWLRERKNEQSNLGKAGHQFVTKFHNIENYVSILMRLYKTKN